MEYNQDNKDNQNNQENNLLELKIGFRKIYDFFIKPAATVSLAPFLAPTLLRKSYSWYKTKENLEPLEIFTILEGESIGLFILVNELQKISELSKNYQQIPYFIAATFTSSFLYETGRFAIKKIKSRKNNKKLEQNLEKII